MSDQSHSHVHTTVGNIRLAFFLNLAFAILEGVGGLLTNSIAILAGALHDLGDSATLAGFLVFGTDFPEKQGP